jgi:hypothetical protein
MDEALICCMKDSFFGLGGNSVTAIQLIFQIRTNTSHSVTVQELFGGPTVRGICATIKGKMAKSGQSSEEEETIIEGDGYEIMCLQTGSPEHAPILLFNPAGASGLW